jgi:hypothetical protein
MAKRYMFVAGADSCGACAGLDGTISDGGLGPQHDNCHCQDVPVDGDDEDCPTIEYGDVHVQTTGATSTVSAEVTVICCDQTEIGQSMEQDLGPMSPNLDEALAAFAEFVESAGAELAEDCPEGDNGWVEEGEEEGLA